MSSMPRLILSGRNVKYDLGRSVRVSYRYNKDSTAGRTFYPVTEIFEPGERPLIEIHSWKSSYLYCIII